MAAINTDSQPGAGSVVKAGFPDRGKRRGENSLRQLFPHTVIQTQRLLIRWSRDWGTVLQALVFPALLLVMLNTVLGRQISSFAGHSALYGTVPLTTLVGVMSGSTAGAVALGREQEEGLLARFWVLPVHRASGLLARFVAEAIRIVATTVIILAAGFALGFRFDQGWLAGIALFIVPLMFGLAFGTLVIAVAVYTAKATLVEGVSLVTSLMMFFSTGFVPLAAYPQWAQPIVEHQPLSYAIEAMRGLSLGGPVREPMIGTVLWSVGIIAVCAVPAAYGYRKASRR